MNLEQARFNMIEQQIRPWEVLDERVLRLLTEIPREEFVPPSERKLAFADIDVPIGHGQCMLAPKIEARMMQALAVQATDMALEIGTGSGYTTALLAKLAKHVVSVDIYEDFATAAKAKLDEHGIKNVTLETGDAANGWEKHAPYDAIAVTGSIPVLPEGILHMLKIGGRLFVIVGNAPIMEALLITRTGQDAWSRESLFETELPPLLNTQQPQQFVF